MPVHLYSSYRQASAKRSHAGIVFTQWSKNRFFPGCHYKTLRQVHGTTEVEQRIEALAQWMAANRIK